MDDFPKVTVVFNGRKYEIILSYEGTVEDLKRSLCDIVGLDPSRQRITNVCFDVLGEKPENDFKIREIFESELYDPPITTFLVEEVAGGSTQEQHAQMEQAGAQAAPFPLQIPKDMVVMSQYATEKLKTLFLPRLSKKLLILDINHTLYDCTLFRTNQDHMGIRPHLQEFLKEVYPYYDLGLWSSTAMDLIDKKVQIMGISNKAEYKFVFYADIQLTVITSNGKSGLFRVKPLTSIYSHFDCYNEKNTIICDDTEANFYLNPKNGVLVSGYSYINCSKDNELLLLKDYLKHIASSTDLSMIDHKDWKQKPFLKKKETGQK